VLSYRRVLNRRSFPAGRRFRHVYTTRLQPTRSGPRSRPDVTVSPIGATACAHRMYIWLYCHEWIWVSLRASCDVTQLVTRTSCVCILWAVPARGLPADCQQQVLVRWVVRGQDSALSTRCRIVCYMYFHYTARGRATQDLTANVYIAHAGMMNRCDAFRARAQVDAVAARWVVMAVYTALDGASGGSGSGPGVGVLPIGSRCRGSSPSSNRRAVAARGSAGWDSLSMPLCVLMSLRRSLSRGRSEPLVVSESVRSALAPVWACGGGASGAGAEGEYVRGLDEPAEPCVRGCAHSW
jgi:hypothetical protein